MLATRTSSARETRSAGGVGRQERRARLAERLEILGAVLAVRDERFDLGEPPVAVDLEAQRDDHRVARLAHRREGDDLPGGLIGDVQLVSAASGDRVPEAVAQLEPLPVLGVLDAAGQRTASSDPSRRAHRGIARRCPRDTRDRTSPARRPRHRRAHAEQHTPRESAPALLRTPTVLRNLCLYVPLTYVSENCFFSPCQCV